MCLIHNQICWKAQKRSLRNPAPNSEYSKPNILPQAERRRLASPGVIHHHEPESSRCFSTLINTEGSRLSPDITAFTLISVQFHWSSWRTTTFCSLDLWSPSSAEPYYNKCFPIIERSSQNLFLEARTSGEAPAPWTTLYSCHSG